MFSVAALFFFIPTSYASFSTFIMINLAIDIMIYSLVYNDNKPSIRLKKKLRMKHRLTRLPSAGPPLNLSSGAAKRAGDCNALSAACAAGSHITGRPVMMS